MKVQGWECFVAFSSSCSSLGRDECPQCGLSRASTSPELTSGWINLRFDRGVKGTIWPMWERCPGPAHVLMTHGGL